jgi:hypothetical protein
MRTYLPLCLALASATLASGLLPSSSPREAPLLGATARADDAVVLSTCTIRGVQPIRKGQQLFDAPRGGRLLGQFTGAIGPASVTLPVDLNVRVRVRTSAGKPTLRLDGWSSLDTFQVYTTRDVPVLQGSLWLATGHVVQPVKVAGDQLTGELTVQGSQDRKLRGTTACDAFSLDRTRPVPFDIPGNARGYLTKGSTVTLFDGAGGTEILEMALAEGASQLFWSTESKGAFVHVLSRGDIVVDAWARLRDLSPLKKGEMMDQYVPPSTQTSGAQLKLEKDPRVLKVAREIPVRLRPDDKDKPIGVIEAGAEIFEVGSTPRWINVLPRELHVTPPSDAGYWIPADAVAPPPTPAPSPAPAPR